MSDPDPLGHSFEWGLLVDGRYETVPAASEADARYALEQRRDDGAQYVQLVQRRRCHYTHTVITAAGDRLAELDATERRLEQLEWRVARLRGLHLPAAGGGCRAGCNEYPCQSRILLDELYPETPTTPIGSTP